MQLLIAFLIVILSVVLRSARLQVFLWGLLQFLFLPNCSFYFCESKWINDIKKNHFFMQSRIFYPQLTLRQLIQPYSESYFIVRAQLVPNISSCCSCAGLQVVIQSTHPSKDFYSQLVLNSYLFDVPKLGLRIYSIIIADSLRTARTSNKYDSISIVIKPIFNR